MLQRKRIVSSAVSAALCFAALPLAGCNHTSASAVPPISASAPTTSPVSAPIAAPAALPQAASAPDAYTLPSANQLYELVAPIALFPDKLLAQVLAGSTYPDQVVAADQWLAQNSTLKGSALKSAVDLQAWDASIKSLSGFRSVLDQMAQNPQWTAALGEAYVNDPTDVMNAVQVMRQRAHAQGALKSNAQQQVSQIAFNAALPVDPSATQVQAGQPGSVIVPPPQTIVIEPAQPGIVYVPVYNPTVVYGMTMPLYPGYLYAPPAYSEADMVATGLISFGLGVVVGAALDNHYNWGWNSWGMHWNGGYPGVWGAHGGVVYHGGPYVSHSTTVINHFNHVNVGSGARPDFDRDGNHHLVNQGPGPAREPNWTEHHDTPDFSHHADQPHYHDMTRPDFTSAMHPDRPPVAQGAPRAAIPQAGRPYQEPRQDYRQPDVRPTMRPAVPGAQTTGQLPRQHLQAAQVAHEPNGLAARSAPLTDRGGDESVAHGLGAWHRR